MSLGSKFIEKQKNEILGQIKSYLNIDVNKEKFDVNKAFLKKDIVTNEILKSYNARTGSDFQNSLISMISPVVLEKLNDDMIEKSQKELGIEIDASKKEELKKKDGVLSESDIKKEILKVTYETVLKKYNNLREKIYVEGFENQISTGNISVGERRGLELISYEKIIKKLDFKYMDLEGKFISEDNEEIKEKEELYMLKNNENQKLVNEKSEINNKKIEFLNEKLEQKMDDIIELKNDFDTMDEKKYQSQMEYLQKDYLDTLTELRYLEVDVLDISTQIKEKQEFEKNREANELDKYEEKKEKKLNPSVTNLDEKQEEKEEENFEDSKVNMFETEENIQEAAVEIDANESIRKETAKQVRPISEQIEKYSESLTVEEKNKDEILEINEGR